MIGNRTFGALRRAALATAPLALALTLAACGDGGGNGGGGNVGVTPTPSPSPSPSPSPTPTPASRNVSMCLTQTIPGTGLTPASLVIPDTMRINLSQPNGYPNGRQLSDPVIDVILAALFLDLTKHPVTTFVGLPLNPAANDRAFLTTFPFAAPPQGTPPLATGTGTSFNFRTDPAGAYTRVDRTGQPAVSAAVIGGPVKNAYNDAGPADDVSGTFVPEITNQLTLLHNALADDLIALGLTPCSR